MSDVNFDHHGREVMTLANCQDVGHPQGRASLADHLAASHLDKLQKNLELTNSD
jgi:hypothetical protein